jgi:hypothetical protein
MKENKNFISVKLFTKQEDEEKQKKINNLNNPNAEKEKNWEINEYSFKSQERIIVQKEQKPLDNEFDGEINHRHSFNNELYLTRILNNQSISENQVYGNEKSSMIHNNIIEGQDKVRQSNANLKDQGRDFHTNEDKHSELIQTQMHFPLIKEKEEDLFSESFMDNFSQFGVDELPLTSEDNRNSASFYMDQINQNSSKIAYLHPFRNWSYPQMTIGPVYPVFYPPGSFPAPQWNNGYESRSPLILKYVCNYEIQIENDTKFRVTKRLIGNKGLILKKILFDSCIKFGDFTTKIRLRGRGSGYKEGALLRGKFFIFTIESDDPMQLCISSLGYESYTRCCGAVEILLKQIYQEYFNFNFQNYKILEASPKEILKNEYVVNRY